MLTSDDLTELAERLDRVRERDHADITGQYIAVKLRNLSREARKPGVSRRARPDLADAIDRLQQAIADAPLDEYRSRELRRELAELRYITAPTRP